MLDNTKKKKKRIYKCHNLSGNPEKDSRESAFAAEVLNNSTFKVMNFILFYFFLRKLVPVGYQKMAWPSRKKISCWIFPLSPTTLR